MICPGCKSRCSLRIDEPQYYECSHCHAREMNNPAGPGTMWMKEGKVIAAPEAVAQQEEKASKRDPDNYT